MFYQYQIFEEEKPIGMRKSLMKKILLYQYQVFEKDKILLLSSKIHCILRKHKISQTHFSPISIQNIYPAVGDLIIQNKQRSKDSGL